MISGRRRIWKCLLVAGLLTLLAFVSGVCAVDTYTVCGSGCDYTSIQAAIDSARPGDIIEVYSSTYAENVHVRKQLILRGIDTGSGKPVVDAGGLGSAIRLSYDGIILDGFTAINVSGVFPAAGILVNSNNNKLINNTANLNEDYGIYLSSSSNNTIANNTASYNSVGIYLSSSSNNTLSGNTPSDNANSGIRLDHSSNNSLYDNSGTNNTYGIFLFYSTTNNLTDNIASNNAIGIFLFYSTTNNLTDNIASNNAIGIRLDISCPNNTLTGNTANSNNNQGISMHSSSKNSLTDNMASNNYYGIWLSSSHNSTLTGNNASNNEYGIYLYFSSTNLIFNNYFNNTNNAWDDGNNIWNVSTTPGTNIIDGPYLGGNYWSDYAGEDTTDDGLGDTLLPYNFGIAFGGDRLPLVMAAVPVNYDLTVTSTDGGSVTEPGEGTFEYLEGTVVNLEATPDTGYRFVSWTGDVDTVADVTAATTTITMDGNCAITANFEAITQSLDEYIAGLPDTAFNNNPDRRKNALSERLEEVRLMIDAGEYDKAIKKLEDIRAKADGSLGGNPKNDWITDPFAQTMICFEIDKLIAYLEALL